MRYFLVRSLIPVGRAQAWLAQTWRDTDSEWTRWWTLALWFFARPIFLLGFTLFVPREIRELERDTR